MADSFQQKIDMVREALQELIKDAQTAERKIDGALSGDNLRSLLESVKNAGDLSRLVDSVRQLNQALESTSGTKFKDLSKTFDALQKSLSKSGADTNIANISRLVEKQAAALKTLADVHDLYIQSAMRMREINTELVREVDTVEKALATSTKKMREYLQGFEESLSFNSIRDSIADIHNVVSALDRFTPGQYHETAESLRELITTLRDFNKVKIGVFDSSGISAGLDILERRVNAAQGTLARMQQDLDRKIEESIKKAQDQINNAQTAARAAPVATEEPQLTRGQKAARTRAENAAKRQQESLSLNQRQQEELIVKRMEEVLRSGNQKNIENTLKGYKDVLPGDRFQELEQRARASVASSATPESATPSRRVKKTTEISPQQQAYLEIREKKYIAAYREFVRNSEKATDEVIDQLTKKFESIQTELREAYTNFNMSAGQIDSKIADLAKKALQTSDEEESIIRRGTGPTEEELQRVIDKRAERTSQSSKKPPRTKKTPIDKLVDDLKMAVSRYSDRNADIEKVDLRVGKIEQELRVKLEEAGISASEIDRRIEAYKRGRDPDDTAVQALWTHTIDGLQDINQTLRMLIGGASEQDEPVPMAEVPQPSEISDDMVKVQYLSGYADMPRGFFKRLHYDLTQVNSIMGAQEKLEKASLLSPAGQLDSLHAVINIGRAITNLDKHFELLPKTFKQVFGNQDRTTLLKDLAGAFVFTIRDQDRLKALEDLPEVLELVDDRVLLNRQKEAGVEGGGTPEKGAAEVSMLRAGYITDSLGTAKAAGIDIDSLLSEEERRKSQIVRQSAQELFKGTGLEGIGQEYVVAEKRTMANILGEIVGHNSPHVKDFLAGIPAGITTMSGVDAAGNTTQVAVPQHIMDVENVLKNHTFYKTAETAIHEMTHELMAKLKYDGSQNIANAKDNIRAELRNRRYELSTDPVPVFDAIRNLDKNLTYSIFQQQNGKFVNMDYYLNTEEAIAHVSTAIISGNEDMQKFFKQLYGQGVYDKIAAVLKDISPETYKDDEESRQRFQLFKDAIYEKRKPQTAPAPEAPVVAVSEKPQTVAEAVLDTVKTSTDAVSDSAKTLYEENRDTIRYYLDQIVIHLSRFGSTITGGITSVYKELEPVFQKVGTTFSQILQDIRPHIEAALQQSAEGLESIWASVSTKIKGIAGVDSSVNFLRAVPNQQNEKEEEVGLKKTTIEYLGESIIQQLIRDRVGGGRVGAGLEGMIPHITDVLSNIATLPVTLNFGGLEHSISSSIRAGFKAAVEHGYTGPPDIIQGLVTEKVVYPKFFNYVLEKQPGQLGKFIGAAVKPENLDIENELRDLIRSKTGNNVVDLQVQQTYDLQEGIRQIGVQAVDTSGQIINLTGKLNEFGDFEINKPKENLALFDRLAEEVGEGLRQSLIEPFEEFGMAILEVVGLLITFQRQVGSLAATAQSLNPTKTQSKIREEFTVGALDVSAQTGQSFENVIPANVENYKLLAGIESEEMRRAYSHKLTKTQMGYQTITGADVGQTQDMMPALFRGEFAKLSGIEDLDLRTKTAVENIESLFSLMINIERETGVTLDQLAPAYTKISKPASDVGLDEKTTNMLIAQTSLSEGILAKDSAGIIEDQINLYKDLLHDQEKLSTLGSMDISPITDTGELMDFDQYMLSILSKLEETGEAAPELREKIASIFDKPEQAESFNKFIDIFKESKNLSEDVDTDDASFSRLLDDIDVNIASSIDSLKSSFLQFVTVLLETYGLGEGISRAFTSVAKVFSFLTDVITVAADTEIPFLGSTKAIEGIYELMSLLADMFVLNAFKMSNLGAPIAKMFNTAWIGFRSFVQSFVDLRMKAETTEQFMRKAGANIADAFITGSEGVENAVDVVARALTEVGLSAGASAKMVEYLNQQLNQTQAPAALKGLTAEQVQNLNPEQKQQYIYQQAIEKKEQEKKDEDEKKQRRVEAEYAVSHLHALGASELYRRVNQEDPQRTYKQHLMQSYRSQGDTQRSIESLRKDVAIEQTKQNLMGTIASRPFQLVAGGISGYLGASGKPGIAPGIDGKFGQHLKKWGGIAGEFAMPVAIDATLGGLTFDSMVTSLGGAMAGTFITALTGNPELGMVGYAIAQGFLWSIDAAGFVGTSEREKKSVVTAISKAQIAQSAPDKLDELERQQSSLEKERLDRANQTFNLGAFTSVLKDLEKQGYGGGFGGIHAINDVSSWELRNYEKYVIKGETIGDFDFASKLWAGDYNIGAQRNTERLYQLLQEDRFAGLRTIALDKNVSYSNMSELMQIIAEKARSGELDAATKEAFEQLNETLEETNSELTKVNAGGNSLVPYDLEARQKEREEMMSDMSSRQQYRYSAKMEMDIFGPGGSALQELESRYAPTLDAVYSGQYDETEEGIAYRDSQVEEYEAAKASLEGMSEILSTVIPLSEVFGQDITGINELLYSMGAEGQQAFMSQIGAIVQAQQELEYFAALQQSYVMAQQDLSAVTAEGDKEKIALAQEAVDKLEKELVLRKASAEEAQKYLKQSAIGEPGTLMQMAQQQAQQSQRRRWVPGTPGTPAQFRLPSITDVSEYSNEDIQNALAAAREKQASLTSMFPQMAEEFAKSQFMLEAGGQFSGVTGVDSSFFNEALRNTKDSSSNAVEYIKPDMVDVSDLSQEEYQKVVARARQMQAEAVSIAPGLAEEYEGSNLLMLQENNKLLLEQGLSQDFLRLALEENTSATEDNSDQLRGHYNLPAGYTPPTVWDYYAEGGKEAGDVNYVAPPGQEGAEGGMVPLSMAQSIAEQMLVGGAGATEGTGGGPDLSALGNLIDPGAAQLGFPEPGTEGTPGHWMELPDLQSLNIPNPQSIEIPGAESAIAQAIVGDASTTSTTESAVAEDKPLSLLDAVLQATQETASKLDPDILGEITAAATDVAAALTEALKPKTEETSTSMDTASTSVNNMATSIDTASAETSASLLEIDTSLAGLTASATGVTTSLEGLMSLPFEQVRTSIDNLNTAFVALQERITNFDPMAMFKNIQVIEIKAQTVNVHGAAAATASAGSEGDRDTGGGQRSAPNRLRTSDNGR